MPSVANVEWLSVAQLMIEVGWCLLCSSDSSQLVVGWRPGGHGRGAMKVGLGVENHEGDFLGSI